MPFKPVSMSCPLGLVTHRLVTVAHSSLLDPAGRFQQSRDRRVGLSCAGGRAARGADDKAKAGLGVRKETVPKGRVAFRHAIRQRLLPALRAFNPDLVLLSAGFDGGGTDQGNVKLVDENRPQGAQTLLSI